jgi:hypothetical protein
MSPTSLEDDLVRATSTLYAEFSKYTYAGKDFCTFCYSSDDILEITTTPIRELSSEAASKLLWEVSDHWESADVYRHYLPRFLEIMGPPWNVEDTFEEHIFYTLRGVGFDTWPEGERSAVLGYLRALKPFLALSDDELEGWTTAYTDLAERA